MILPREEWKRIQREYAAASAAAAGCNYCPPEHLLPDGHQSNSGSIGVVDDRGEQVAKRLANLIFEVSTTDPGSRLSILRKVVEQLLEIEVAIAKFSPQGDNTSR